MDTFFRRLLIIILAFNAIGAFYGGFHLITDPTGESIQMPKSYLAGSIFNDYLLPGIILVVFVGLFSTAAVVGLTTRKPEAPLPFLPIWKNRHWSWTLAFICGIALLIWIGVQIAMIGYFPEFPIQAVYGTIGLLVTLLPLAPGVQRQYLLKP